MRSPPTIKYGPQRFLLSLIHDLASPPRYGLDQLTDLPLDAIAEIVGVHRVKLPTIRPMIGDEPLVAGVFALIGCRERRQSRQLVGC